MLNDFATTLFIPTEEDLELLKAKDILLASFPRSGNTWMRHLIGDVILQSKGFETGTLLPVHRVSADIHVKDSISDLDENLKLPFRLIKSHHFFSSKLAQNKIIYIFRDPVDSLCGYYHYSKKYNLSLMEEQGITQIDDFCCYYIPYYCHHLETYIEAKRRNPDSILFVSYESLHEIPLAALQSCIKFCGLESNQEFLRVAIENHQFEKHYHAPHGRFFFRRGKVGSGYLEISAETEKIIASLALPLYRHAREIEYSNYGEPEASVVRVNDEDVHDASLLSNALWKVVMFRNHINTLAQNSIKNQLSIVNQALSTTQNELSSVKSELSSVKSELSLQKACFEKASQDLSQAQEELISSRTVIKRKSSAVNKLKARISDQEKDLREARRNLRILENRIKQMENSKFWKLRNLWSNLKHLKLLSTGQKLAKGEQERHKC